MTGQLSHPHAPPARRRIRPLRHPLPPRRGRHGRGVPGARPAPEARAIAALNHPNIVSIYDIGDSYIVTGLIDGSSLRKLKPTLREALDYAAQFADGLAAAYSAGITHRDLKPGNIMVTRQQGRVTILDFGLARRTETTGPEDATRTVHAVTQSGVVMGTVAYMSPERARAQLADARAAISSASAPRSTKC
jgi:eukaryotic-like serine/threonine-protein kinase